MKLVVLIALLVSCALAQSYIGTPKGECPNGYHYCEQNGCPFQDTVFCSSVIPVSCADPMTSECGIAVAEYCATAPTDPACDVYNCDASKPYRCPSSYFCAADADGCKAPHPIACARSSEPCHSATKCPGQFDCGDGVCRATLNEPCGGAGVAGRCGGYYPCGNGLCSQSPDQCDPPSVPGGCSTGDPTGDCAYFALDGCDGDQHYCGFECSYENRTFCEELKGCGSTCGALIQTYCRDYPNDPGCCNSGFRCTTGFCAADQGHCLKNQRCTLMNEPCPYTSPCPGRYYCGKENDGTPVCRDNLDDPCPSNPTCETQGYRQYPCGNGLCSGDPARCTFGPLEGKCENGQHLCGLDCPFGNYTFCNSLSGICNPVGQACLAAVDEYCTRNPSDGGCCTAARPTRCATGQCVPTANDCPPAQTPRCVDREETCTYDCPGEYFCGRGASCRTSLNDRCPDGPCAGRFYCGEIFSEAICSDNPILCRPPVVREPPACNNGEHFCEVNGCPFNDTTFCNTLGPICGEVEPGVDRYDDLSTACHTEIDDFCATTPSDPGCCNGNTPHRCQYSFRCAADEQACTSSPLCFREGTACPDTSRCHGGYECGNGECTSSLNEPCAIGSRCPGQFYCGGDYCSDNPDACDPPVGEPLPDCHNGLLLCGANQQCTELNGIYICLCQDGFVPDLTDPTRCNQPGATGTVGADCKQNPCPQNMICSGGTCKCQEGFTLDPRSGSCVPIEGGGTPVTNSQCTGQGDVHYQTFDQVYYDWQGECDLILVRAPNLEVQLRPFQCGNTGTYTVSCVDSVAVKFGSDVIILDDNVAKVNGNPVSTFPHNVATGVQVVEGMWNGFTVLLPDNSQIVFAPYMFQIRLSEDYQGLTSGLCSNWSSTVSNGGLLYHRDGSVTNQGNNYGQAVGFSLSWEVDTGAGDTSLFDTPNSNPACGTKKRSIRPREDFSVLCSSQQLSLAINLCAHVLEPTDPHYADCFQHLDLSGYYLNCLYDVCITGDPLFATNAIQTAISACEFNEFGLSEPVFTTGVATGSSVTGSSVTGSSVTGSSASTAAPQDVTTEAEDKDVNQAPAASLPFFALVSAFLLFISLMM